MSERIQFYAFFVFVEFFCNKIPKLSAETYRFVIKISQLLIKTYRFATKISESSLKFKGFYKNSSAIKELIVLL